MPIDAKAGCLYPNNARALLEARSRGFDNCLMCDMLGNVAELATANVFMAKDGIVMTPIANGTFLNGVTRQRVLQLLRSDGKDAREATLQLCRLRPGGRDFRRRQLWQGDAGAANRRAGPAAGTLLSSRARALLGIRPLSMTAPKSIAGGDHDDPLTIRLDFEAGRRLGAGKVALLELIDRTGSISAAGRAQGMSYRRAWLLVDELNQLFAAPRSSPITAERTAAEPRSPTKAGGSSRSTATPKPRCGRPPERDRRDRARARAPGARAGVQRRAPGPEVTTSSRRGRTA